MLKKALSLLLTFVLAFGMTNTLAFANETEGGAPATQGVTDSSAFPGGYAISPTVAIPAEIHVNDTITFYLNASNFQNPNGYDITKLSAVITGDDAACFEKQAFWRDDITGTVYFSLKAKSEADYQTFTISVTNFVNSAAPHVFSTAVSGAPESSAPSSSSSAPESSVPSSSAPEFGEPSSSAPESGVPSSSAPESDVPSSSAPESGVPSSSAPESGEPSSSAPESSEPPTSSGTDNNSSDNENDGGGFLNSIRNFIKSFSSPAPRLGSGLTGIATAGSLWTHVSGIPSTSGPSTVGADTDIVFRIPDDNFVFQSPGPVADISGTISELQTALGNGTVTIKASSGGQDFTGYFAPAFFAAGSAGSQSVNLQMKVQNVPSDGLVIPKGTVITLNGQARYTFNADLNLVQTVTTGRAKAIGITAGSELGGKNTWISKNGSYYSGGINIIDDAQEGDEFLIHFYPQFFEWDNGESPAKVTLSSIRGKISLRQSNTSGSRVFEVIELASVKGEAVVRIKIKDVFPTVKAVDFRTTIYLTVGGKRDTDSACEIEGTIGDDDPEEFYSEEKYIDISGGIIGQAVEGISRAHVYIGENVTVNVPYLRKNAKFYGAAVTNETTARDQQVLEDYPDIDIVYTLHTLGLNGAGTTVTIDVYGGYYVYDGDLNYLGRTSDDLPYSDKYYLSVKELDIVVGGDDGDDNNDWDGPPLSDGDLIPPANENWNPATGNKA